MATPDIITASLSTAEARAAVSVPGAMQTSGGAQFAPGGAAPALQAGPTQAPAGSPPVVLSMSPAKDYLVRFMMAAGLLSTPPPEVTDCTSDLEATMQILQVPTTVTELKPVIDEWPNLPSAHLLAILRCVKPEMRTYLHQCAVAVASETAVDLERVGSDLALMRIFSSVAGPTLVSTPENGQFQTQVALQGLGRVAFRLASWIRPDDMNAEVLNARQTAQEKAALLEQAQQQLEKQSARAHQAEHALNACNAVKDQFKDGAASSAASTGYIIGLVIAGVVIVVLVVVLVVLANRAKERGVSLAAGWPGSGSRDQSPGDSSLLGGSLTSGAGASAAPFLGGTNTGGGSRQPASLPVSSLSAQPAAASAKPAYTGLPALGKSVHASQGAGNLPP
jgi:hypothetical protein